jgi:Protein of unknown function (DUF3108)
MKHWIALTLLCCAAAHAEVREINTTYSLFKGTLKLGEVTERFTVRDNKYRIESVAKPILSWLLPTLTQTASGTVTADGLRPDHFTQTISNKPEKSRIADFNWSDHELVLTRNGDVSKHELKPQTFDSLSLKYQFMFTPPQNDGSVTLTDGKKVEEYPYRVLKDQMVKTPAGQYDTLHVAKIKDDQNEASFELWLGKDQHYVPVKVMAANDEHMLEQVLTKIVIDEGAQK